MSFIIGLLALSFIVFFHELGHFIFAKIFGVKVLSFSIGMGPVLLHKEIKGVDYRLSLFPFGGYCGMEGENDFRKAIEENLSEFPKKPDSLYGVHPFKRMLIAFGGPFFNFLLSILCCTVINIAGFDYYRLSNRIIIPESSVESPARDAGLLTGDKIFKVNNIDTPYFNELREEISLHPKEELVLSVERNGEILNFKVTTLINKDTGAGVLGIIADNKSIEKVPSKTYSFFPALAHGVTDTADIVIKTFTSLKILFKGVNLTNVVSGPARVSSILGDAVSEGFEENTKIGIISLLQLVSWISSSLGIMNLLPIPVLDGGIILFALIAIIIRKEVPPKVQYRIQFIGLAIIMTLFLIGMVGDFNYFINKWRIIKK